MFHKIKGFLFENRGLYQTIVKNTFWLMLGQFVSRVLRAGIVIYAARVLGASSWGAFSYAIGIAAALTIFSDFGLNALITKEVSREPELRKKYLATALVIKTALIAVLVTLLAAAGSRLTNIAEVKVLIPVVVFVFTFDGLRNLGSALARSMEKMEIEAFSDIFTNFAIASLGFAFLSYISTARSLAVAYALGSGLGILGIYIPLKKHLAGFLREFQPSLIKPILFKAWPFGLMGLMGAVMLNTDIIMLGWMKTAKEVGFYSAAQKPIQLLYILPSFLATSIFPALSRFTLFQKEKFRELMSRSLKIILAAALPISLGCFFSASLIISILYGSEYSPATGTLKILAFTIPLVFPSIIISNAIFAKDLYKNLLTYVGLGVFGNIFFNLLFIPAWGIEGAAISTLLNQLIINGYAWFTLKRIVSTS